MMRYETDYYQPSLANKVLHRSIDLCKINYYIYDNKRLALRRHINDIIMNMLSQITKSYMYNVEFEISTVLNGEILDIYIKYYKVINNMDLINITIDLKCISTRTYISNENFDNILKRLKLI